MSEAESDRATHIAIIGMGCRFPGAKNPHEFWRNLASGQESLTELSTEELAQSGESKSLLNQPNYVPRGMFLDGFDLFDPGFFGLSRIEASVMDPQHRQFLECAWETFEDAGRPPQTFRGAIAVFAGSGQNNYFHNNVLTQADILDNQGYFLLRHTGNDKDFLATRASYCFNLTGPSVSVQSACSTSLVAIHLAIQSLLDGECDMALAGGVSIELPQRRGYLFKENEILSIDGHCRPFDAKSSGTVFSSGVGCVLLRRLDDAIAQGDNIQAVIRGSAVNNDGADKVSYLAPSVSGQTAVVEEALEIAGVTPSQVTFIECHGTGTQMGDPIEVSALTQVFSDDERQHPCVLGSVKSNIGHTDNAAGVASVIKVVESLKHRQIPATLHFEMPNPNLDLSATPFLINASTIPWETDTSRIAGVTSLGVGGTNAHLILEQPDEPDPTAPINKPCLLLLSARSISSLDLYTAGLAEYLGDDDRINLHQAACTLALGRRSFDTRRFAVVDSLEGAINVLDAMQPTALPTRELHEEDRDIAFMFAGGGAQYPNMGLALYNQERVFHDAIEECVAILSGVLDYDLKEILYPTPDRIDDAAVQMQRPSRALPCLFVTQYATTMLWRSWGCEPAALIGHSMGENTAACIAGIMSLKDTLALVALRGRLFESVDTGGMISCELTEEELIPLLGNELDIAAINAPNVTVASGPVEKIEILEKTLLEAEIGFQRIHIQVAAHSRMLDPILEEFHQFLRSIELNPPSLPVISNLTGTWLTQEQAISPDYWRDHLRHTVRFADGAGNLLADNKFVLLETGPGAVVSSLAGMHPARSQAHTIQSSMPRPGESVSEINFLLHALGNLWLGHARIDWTRFFETTFSGDLPRRISLPTYRFEQEHYWLAADTHDLPEQSRRTEIEDWFYTPTWIKTQPIAMITKAENFTVLVLGNHPLLDSFESVSGDIIRVRSGQAFEKSSANEYFIRLSHPDDYLFLIRSLLEQQRIPGIIVCGFALELDEQISMSDEQRTLAFDSLLYLAQAVASEDIDLQQKWILLTRQALQLGSEEIYNPLGSLVTGPLRAINQELANTYCKLLDLSADFSLKSTDQLVAEILQWPEGDVVAFRGRGRYTLRYLKSELPEPPTVSAVKADGVYLITGGLGEIATTVALELSRKPVKLVLASRRAPPDRVYWQQLIDIEAPEAGMIRQFYAIEASGSELCFVQCDVTDVAQVSAMQAQIADRFGEINGIFHTAGILDDELIFNKDLASAIAVLAPKVTSTLILNQVFDFARLDFVVLFSSTSSIVGLPGQIDYTAANAFLDAFAHYGEAMGWPHVVSINWPAWNETALATGNPTLHQPAGRPVTYPMLDRVIEERPGKTTFSTLISPKKYWMLSEHRIRQGDALIPGTGFLELARAAFAEVHGKGPVVLSHVSNLLPFFVADDEIRELRLQITGDEQRSDFVFYAMDQGDELQFVTGSIGRAHGDVQITGKYTEILSRCQGQEQYFIDPDHHPFLDFGERWSVLQKVSTGHHEAIIDLSFPVQHARDLDDYVLHPAIVDMATAGAQVLMDHYHPQTDLWVPVTYGEVTVYLDMPMVSYAHTRYRPGADSNQALFDIDLFNQNHELLLKVSDFELRKIDKLENTRRDIAPVSISPKILEFGITRTEGAQILNRVMDAGFRPQIVVSPYPFDHYLSELAAANSRPISPPGHDADGDPEIPVIQDSLGKHPAMAELIVRSHLDQAGERRLIAHYLPNSGVHVTVSELRKFARQVLAPDQIPKHFVEISGLTRSADGEIDRSVYTDPFATVDKYIPPVTATEKKLARIWADLLGNDRISRADNFFDIGGHSLVSIRAIVRVEKKLGVRLDQAKMALLTLEQIAHEIDQGSNGPTDQRSTSTETKRGLLGTIFKKP